MSFANRWVRAVRFALGTGFVEASRAGRLDAGAAGATPDGAPRASVGPMPCGTLLFGALVRVQ